MRRRQMLGNYPVRCPFIIIIIIIIIKLLFWKISYSKLHVHTQLVLSS